MIYGGWVLLHVCLCGKHQCFKSDLGSYQKPVKGEMGWCGRTWRGWKQVMQLYSELVTEINLWTKSDLVGPSFSHQVSIWQETEQVPTWVASVDRNGQFLLMLQRRIRPEVKTQSSYARWDGQLVVHGYHKVVWSDRWWDLRVVQGDRKSLTLAWISSTVQQLSFAGI